MAKKTYNQKLNDTRPHEIITLPPDAAVKFGGTLMLVATPLIFDGIIRQIPSNEIVTMDELRSHLARQYGADCTCQLTAGIFVNIVANASHERQIDATPYWRVLKKNGELNEKFPNGLEGHKKLLQQEGHTVIQKGKKYFVQNYQDVLFDLNTIKVKCNN
ncbi:MAG: MGMT family protein [Clostridiales bacterium]|jgi:hypothetical protein|nr:MGMT family protein [Clostridiales bacterium]